MSNDSGVILYPGGGNGTSVQRTGFGTAELEKRHETQSSALAARAQAEIQARWIVAMQRPRNWDTVRLSLLKECERPGFAESAVFAIKRGRKKNEATGKWEDNIIEGLTIRFAEAAMRAMGNMVAEPTVVYDDDAKRVVRVTVMDLESNSTFTEEFVMRKVVERKELKGDQVALGERFNSYGDRVFLVEATDDEVAQKQAVLASKAIRNGILRLLPGDYKDDCFRRVAETKAAEVKRDPDKAKRDILEGFHRLGVYPEALAAYLGHPLEQITSSELIELRGVFVAVRDSEITWPEALRARQEDRGEVESDAKKPSPAREKLAKAVEKQRQAAAKSAPPAEPAATEVAAEAPAEPEKAPEPAKATAPPEKKAEPAPKAEKPKPPPPPPPPPEDVEGPVTCKDCGTPVDDGGTPAEGGGSRCEACAS